MESMTLEQRKQFISDRLCEILKAFDEFEGQDISRLTIKNRDKLIEGRLASDKAVSDHLLIKMRELMELYQSYAHHSADTAALLFLVNYMDRECVSVDVIAKVEVKANDAA